MLLFALISGFAFGIYDSLGLELVMDSLPDPRRAGHDLGIYALANSAGLALAAIIGALLVNAFEHSFGYYLLFPSAIVMVLLPGNHHPHHQICRIINRFEYTGQQ